VEGFSPELAVVTHGGGKELEEPAVIRPTSETIINTYFSKWVQSYRDLPLLVNQWCNVVRWELRPRLFLRTSEFLWQEGHTCHATQEDARDYALRILSDVYAGFMTDVLAVPVHKGRKTDRERFAGADTSWTTEGMMRDGKALQMSTSHELGQNFARAFDTMFTSDNDEREYVWQTSWGASTRLMGALIMAHGDDNGLRVPPALAPTQAVVLLIRGDDGAGEHASALATELAASGVRVKLDDHLESSFGRRVTEWELRGVPVRVEVGPRDLADGNVVLVRRDTGEKRSSPVGEVEHRVSMLLADIQASLLAEATAFRDERTVAVSSVDEAVDAATSGFAVLPWASIGADGEAELNAKGVSVRCLQTADGGLPRSADEPGTLAYVARAY
jgi:prolyl-tRNA synthetase